MMAQGFFLLLPGSFTPTERTVYDRSLRLRAFSFVGVLVYSLFVYILLLIYFIIHDGHVTVRQNLCLFVQKKKQKLICINILGSEKRFHAQHYPLHNKQTNTKPTRIESTKIAHKQYKAHTFATTWHKQPMGQPNTQHKWMWAFSARDVWWRWQQSERERT